MRIKVKTSAFLTALAFRPPEDADMLPLMSLTILSIVRDYPEITQRDIIAKWCPDMSRQRVSLYVNKLLKPADGGEPFLESQRNAWGGAVKYMHLTPRGKRLVEQMELEALAGVTLGGN